MSELRRSYPSLIVYAWGMASLLACDFMATGLMDAESIAMWSRVRSIFFFFPALLLFGLDQVLVRVPSKTPHILRSLRWHILLGSVLAAVVLDVASYLDWKLALASALASTLSAAGFQLCRALDGRTKAQILSQGWKILLALVFLALWIARPATDFSLVLTIAFATAALLSSGFLWRSMRLRRPTRMSNCHYALGSRLVVTGVLLAASTYGELLLINVLALPNSASSYFAHLVYFTLPSTALAGYLSFIIVPLGRRRSLDLSKMASLTTPWFLIGALVLTLAGQVLGFVAWQLIKPNVGALDIQLAALLAFAGFLRLIYVPISAYSATYGTIALQDQLMRAQVAAILLSAIAFIVLIVAVGGDIRILVAITVILHLALRIVLMRRCVVQDWKVRHPEREAKLSYA